jgi:2-polyprenyl-3-methyl-5-hydroxy-6-metoxy-1,4-benzoquinol methylase
MRIQSDKIDNDSVVSRSKEWGNLSQSVQYCLEKVPSADSHILDIGCNTGSLMYNLSLRGFKHVYGIDIEENKIEEGRLIYPELVDKLEKYNGTTLPYENDSFDVVTMFDVIEHIEGVRELLGTEIRRVLKKGGLLIFQTPNKITNIPWEILIHRSFNFYKNYHVSLQTYTSLRRLLGTSGFVEVTIEKREILSDYYLQQLRSYVGILAYPVLLLWKYMPSPCSPNFWGCCVNGKDA